LDCKLDESYTPKHLSVRVGNSLETLREVRSVELSEPQGWVHVALQAPGTPPPARRLRACLLQLAVLGNQQNGRDTHVRLMKVYGPRLDQVAVLHPNITSDTFSAYAVVR
jgi:anaphase-promoting complex subunit 10